MRDSSGVSGTSRKAASQHLRETVSSFPGRVRGEKGPVPALDLEELAQLFAEFRLEILHRHVAVESVHDNKYSVIV